MSQLPVVEWSAEFERIRNLPRLVAPPPGSAEAATMFTTPDFRTDLGRREGAGLRPEQSWALWTIYWYRGLFAALPPGIGKTLISWLAALVLGSRRPYLILPASLAKEKTRDDFARYARHWQTPQPPPTILTYTALTLRKNLYILDEVKPDLLIFDEAHKIRKLDKSAAQRIDRYVEATNVPVVVLSGSVIRKSVADFAHLIRWVCKERSPLPRVESDLWQWCQALDEDSKVGLGRWAPGPLLELPPYPEAESLGKLARARCGVRRRIAETPGVVMRDGDDCNAPLSFDFLIPPHDASIEAAFDHLYRTDEAWDGWPLEDNLSRFAYKEQAGCGFFYYHDPRPPDDWMNARRAWCTFCREEIKASRNTSKPLDTAGAVADFHHDHPTYRTWKEIEPEYDEAAHRVHHWFSASVVYAAAQWLDGLRLRGEVGLVWTDHVAFAQALASVTGVPYYARMGMRIDAYGRSTKDSVEHIRVGADGKPAHSAILSLAANREGRNLQAYTKSLIVGWEQAADLVDQWICRMHRSGQESPCEYTVLLSSMATYLSFKRTLQEARYVREQFGHTQKILKAKINTAKIPTQGARWATRDEVAEAKELGISLTMQ